VYIYNLCNYCYGTNTDPLQWLSHPLGEVNTGATLLFSARLIRVLPVTVRSVQSPVDQRSAHHEVYSQAIHTSAVRCEDLWQRQPMHLATLVLVSKSNLASDHHTLNVSASLHLLRSRRNTQRRHVIRSKHDRDLACLRQPWHCLVPDTHLNDKPQATAPDSDCSNCHGTNTSMSESLDQL
jgi:hypothetical protein